MLWKHFRVVWHFLWNGEKKRSHYIQAKRNHIGSNEVGSLLLIVSKKRQWIKKQIPIEHLEIWSLLTDNCGNCKINSIWNLTKPAKSWRSSISNLKKTKVLSKQSLVRKLQYLTNFKIELNPWNWTKHLICLPYSSSRQCSMFCVILLQKVD